MIWNCVPLQSLRTMRAGGRLATLCGGRRRRRQRTFPPRRSSRSQVGMAMSTISKRKCKSFDIEASYRNKTKTFLFVPLIFGTKQNVSVFSKIVLNWNGTFWRFFKSLRTKPERNRVDFYRIETFPHTKALEKIKRNFCELSISKVFYQFGTFMFAPSCVM